MARAGDVIGGKYRLVHPLGIGGMGAVWRAEHLALQQQVAIKLLDARGPAAERAVKRFQREAQIAASIRHRNVVYISDFGNENGAPYLVMELLAGVPLSERMVVGEPLSVPAFLRIIEETLQGLAAVHAAGVVHRDMKPENIFLVREANDDTFPKLLDFGVSRSTERDAGHTITREGIVMGTPEYVSPEQARGRMADVRSDIYSLGVVMYEGLAGRLPFQADNAADLIVSVLNAVPIPLASLRPDLGERVGQLVGKAMARRPEERFQSTEEMRAALFALFDAEVELEGLSLPRRFMAPRAGSGGVNSEESQSLDQPALGPWGEHGSPARGAPRFDSPSAESMRPTAAIPAILAPLRKRLFLLGFGGLGVLIALAALAFITTGGQPSPAARAESPPLAEPVRVAQPRGPELPSEVLIDLNGLPADARVRVDGRDVVGSPLRLVRGSGEHQITIEAPGMHLWSVMHDAARDGRYAVSLERDAPITPVRRSPKQQAKTKRGLLRRPDF